MTLRLASMPDRPEALADWLEGQLCGPTLRELVAELAVLHEEQSPAYSAEELLGTYRTTTLQQGLRTVPPTLLRQFLGHPQLLLDLQELVLIEGGPYWENRLRDPQVTPIVERVGKRLRVAMGAPEPAPAKNLVPLRFYRRPWLVATLSMAATLAAVWFGWLQLDALNNWGWNQRDLLSQQVGPPEYLASLANAAKQWQTRSHNSRDALRADLQQMRNGCTRLLSAEHRQLQPDDRKWLLGKCRDWGTKLDQHLVDLQTDKDWEQVRKEADTTVEKLIKALRDKAATIQG